MSWDNRRLRILKKAKRLSAIIVMLVLYIISCSYFAVGLIESIILPQILHIVVLVISVIFLISAGAYFYTLRVLPISRKRFGVLHFWFATAIVFSQVFKAISDSLTIRGLVACLIVTILLIFVGFYFWMSSFMHRREMTNALKAASHWLA